MTALSTAHTADLGAAAWAAARALLFDVFDDMNDDGWEHALGGMHVLVWDSAELIGHASVIQRRLMHRGRPLRAGYVEAVAVREGRRGRGHGAALMAGAERIIRGAYEVGALGATEEARGFYAARGWRQWQGPTSVCTPSGVQRTADDDGAIYVLPVSAPLDVTGGLCCDWRGGDAW